MMDVQTLTDLEMAGESRRRQDHGPDKQQRDGHGQRKEVRKENVKRVYKKEATIIVDLRDEKDVKVKVKAESVYVDTHYLPSLQFLLSVLHKQRLTDRPLLPVLVLTHPPTSPPQVYPVQTQNIEKKRDAVVCCLINYLGERQEDLFHDCQECEDYTDKTMKVIVKHNVMAEEDPSDLSIVIEGNQVMEGCGSRTKACILLMGLIYAINIEYPKELKNTFEIDGAKLLKKAHSLKNKLM